MGGILKRNLPKARTWLGAISSGSSFLCPVTQRRFRLPPSVDIIKETYPTSGPDSRWGLWFHHFFVLQCNWNSVLVQSSPVFWKKNNLPSWEIEVVSNSLGSLLKPTLHRLVEHDSLKIISLGSSGCGDSSSIDLQPLQTSTSTLSTTGRSIRKY